MKCVRVRRCEDCGGVVGPDITGRSACYSCWPDRAPTHEQSFTGDLQQVVREALRIHRKELAAKGEKGARP